MNSEISNLPPSPTWDTFLLVENEISEREREKKENRHFGSRWRLRSVGAKVEKNFLQFLSFFFFTEILFADLTDELYEIMLKASLYNMLIGTTAKTQG